MWSIRMREKPTPKWSGKTLELVSAQTRSWRTASSGFAELCTALRNSAKPLEQDRVCAEPSLIENSLESP